MDKVVLIDGSNLIFRAYYASEKQDIRTLAGEPANALQTIIGMLKKIITTEKPSHIYIALDSGKSTFRHDKYEDYKGKRPQIPDRLKVQFTLVQTLYEKMGIKFGYTDKYEADDLIATLASQAKAQGKSVKIISGDKDLLQLIEPNINVLTPKMGFAKEVDYDTEVFVEKYGFTPNRFIEYKALVGDSSDNIIGVAKVGDKTAKKLIQEYQTIDEIIQAAKDGQISGKVGENIANSEDIIYENIELVTLIKDSPVNYQVDELEFGDYDHVGLVKHLKELGFTRYASEFSKMIGVNEQSIINESIEVHVIEEFDQEKHTSDINFLYTQTLHDNYWDSEVLGVAISSDKGTFYLENPLASESFCEFLKSDAKKVTYNAKRLYVIFKEVEVNNIVFDTMLALALLDPNNYKIPLTTIMYQYGIEYLLDFDEVYKVKSNPQKPELELLKTDIGTKATALRDSYLKVTLAIEQNQLETVLYEIEQPLSKVLAKVESNGIYIDKTKLTQLTDEYQIKMAEYKQQFNQHTEINIASTSQLSDYFFKELELPTKGIKKTLKGYSTDVTNLEKLKANLDEDIENYQLAINQIEAVLNYRTYSKLVSTYLLGLEKYIYSDQRIHPLYHQLLSETGRLSTQDPSIQNIPIRSNEGQVIRSVFSGQNNQKIVAIDYSQIELRVMAELSEDEGLKEAFKANKDIHNQTAQLMFGEMNPENRARAKAINFGIIYGMSEYGLSKQVDIDIKTAKQFIEQYFNNYPNVLNYLNAKVKQASETLEVRTMYNRLRKIQGIDSKNFNEREHAKRMAVNTPVQGTAADLIKIAMIKVDDYLQTRDDCKMIMQIHDELVFEVKEESSQEVTKKIVEIMETAVDFSIPLVAEGEIGDNWLEAK